MSNGKDFRASDNPDWQPYRDADGNVVTVSPDTCSAIFHALGIWLKVVDKEGTRADNLYLYDAFANAHQAMGIIMSKSCLLGRILYGGKPPLTDAPPTKYSAPNYSLEVPREDA